MGEAGSEVSKGGQETCSSILSTSEWQPRLRLWGSGTCSTWSLATSGTCLTVTSMHMPYSDINAHLVNSCSTTHMGVHNSRQTYIKTQKEVRRRENKITAILCAAPQPCSWSLVPGHATPQLCLWSLVPGRGKADMGTAVHSRKSRQPHASSSMRLQLNLEVIGERERRREKREWKQPSSIPTDPSSGVRLQKQHCWKKESLQNCVFLRDFPE